jgi:hypothetical protein
MHHPSNEDDETASPAETDALQPWEAPAMRRLPLSLTEHGVGISADSGGVEAIAS